MKKKRRRHTKARYALKIAGKRHNFRLKRAARKAAVAARRSGRSVVAVPGHPTGLAARRSKKRRSSSKKRHSVRKNRRRSRRVRRNVSYATANRRRSRRHSVRRNRRHRRSRR
jgi:hypothetical protein